MKWHPYGRNAILVEFAEKADDWALHKRCAVTDLLSNKPPPQLLEFVPGFTTVLLEFDLSTGQDLSTLADEVIHLLQSGARKKIPLGPLKEIPVKYGGPDLARVATHNGITPEKVIHFHSTPVYKVQLLGFSPGFPYLGELHHKLHTPRLDSPRLKIFAGSVAIGGRHTGIYTVDSPGGWNIIGHTEIKIFDLERAIVGVEEDAFFLQQGDQVKFVPV